MLEIAPQEPLVLDVVKYTFVNAASKNVEESIIGRKLSATTSSLILAFRDAPGSGLLLDCLRAIITAVPTGVTPSTASISLSWLLMIRNSSLYLLLFGSSP